MKKNTRNLVVIIAVFALGVLVLAPQLFHKRQTTSSNPMIVSKTEPEVILKTEPFRTNPPVTVPGNQLQEPVVRTAPKPVSKNVPAVSGVSIPGSAKTIPQKPKVVLKKENQPVIIKDKPLISKNNQPIIPKKPVIPKQSQKREPDSQADTVEPERPSPWGVVLLASNAGIDGGLSYRLAQIPVFNGIDLDLVAGVKQAGLGLSKHVDQNLGFGLTGTVTYSSGEKNLGVYGKYSF